MQDKLFDALKHNRLDVVKVLIRDGVDINATYGQYRDTPLILTAQDGHINIAKYLLHFEANIDTRDTFDMTALMHACFHGHLNIVQLLIDARANIHVKNKLDKNSLMIAAEKGHLNILQQLLRAGADVNVTGGIFQDSPLILAVEGGHSEIVQELLHSGANINAQTITGQSALMIATHRHQLEIIQILINAGAILDGRNRMLMQRLNEIKHSKIAYLKEIYHHFLTSRVKFPNPVIDIIISYHMTNIDRLTISRTERQDLYHYIELAESLRQNLNPILIKNLNQHTLLSPHRIPPRSLLECMKNLLDLLQFQTSNQVLIYVLADLVQVNGKIIQYIPPKLKNDKSFFWRLSSISKCESHDEIRRSFLTSSVSKELMKSSLLLALGALILSDVISFPLTKRENMLIGLLILILGGVYTAHQVQTHRRGFLDVRQRPVLPLERYNEDSSVRLELKK